METLAQLGMWFAGCGLMLCALGLHRIASALERPHHQPEEQP